MAACRPTLVALALATALAPCAQRAQAMPRPSLDVGLGSTFWATGSPSGGGLSASLSPLWPVLDRARFGATLFADDIGTTVVQLYDRNDGTALGPAAENHRWAYGAAWRGDFDVLTRPKWSLAGTGAWGYWRVEDDRRGTTTAAAGAVGFALGVEGLRSLNARHSAGLALRYHRLFPDRRAAYARTQRYASAALEWRWESPGER